MYGTERKTNEVSRYLFTRGCWLVLIEFSVVRFGWTFSFKIDYLVIQVIFVIGASMIVLAALVHPPRWAIATVGLALIAGHNLFDGIKAEQLGAAAPVWHLLHQPGAIDLTRGFKLFVLYPLIPWIGVMAAGYALGPVFRLEREIRVRQLFVIGALFLAMTLGPALMLVAFLDGAQGIVAVRITIFGRVPLFYYIAHIYLLHACAVFAATYKADGYGFGLAGIYTVWLAVVILLYPLCYWFASGGAPNGGKLNVTATRWLHCSDGMSALPPKISLRAIAMSALCR